MQPSQDSGFLDPLLSGPLNGIQPSTSTSTILAEALHRQPMRTPLEIFEAISSTYGIQTLLDFLQIIIDRPGHNSLTPPQLPSPFLSVPSPSTGWETSSTISLSAPSSPCPSSSSAAVSSPAPEPSRCTASGCTTTTTSKKDMRRHQRVVHGLHGGSAHFCPVASCPRSRRAFSRRDNWKVHMRNVHSTAGQDAGTQDGAPTLSSAASTMGMDFLL